MGITFLDDESPKKKITFLDEEPKESITQMLGRNLKEAAQETLSDAGGAITRGLNAVVFNIPKALTELQVEKGVPGAKQALDFMFPEAKTGQGKVLQGATELGGMALGGPGRLTAKAIFALGKAGGLATKAVPALSSPIPRFLGKVAGGGAAGAAGMATIAPEAMDPEKYGQQIKTGAVFGGALPVAGGVLKIAGKGISGAGRFVAKNVGGITDASRDFILKHGPEKVFDPLKAKADYIGTVVVPKAQKKITDFIQKASQTTRPVLRQLGFDDEDVKALSSLVPLYKQRLGQVLSGNHVNIKLGIEKIKEDAATRFNAVMSKVNPNTAIDVKNFYNTLRGELVSKGWLNKAGGEVATVGKNPVRDQLLSVYKYLTSTIKTDTGGYRKNILNLPEYENVRNALETAYDQTPSNQAVIAKLGGAIRKDAEKVIKGLSSINKFYSDAIKLQEMEGKGLFSKALDPVKLEQKLLQMKNVMRPNQTEPMKNVIGKDLYDDVFAHFVNKDFGLVSDIPGAGGGIFTGRSGIAKAAVTEGAKRYYRDIKPALQKISPSRFGGRLKQYYDEPIGINKNSGKIIKKALLPAAAGAALLASDANAYELPKQETLGVKNNNPVNLKAFDKWKGMMGKDKQGHAKFIDMDHGVRAALRNLKVHASKHPDQTLKQYLNTFAEANGTKEAEYIAKVLGVDVNSKLKNLDMEKVVIPMAKFESKITITEEDLKRVKEKFSGKKK